MKRDEKSFFDAASYMKNRYTSIFLGAFEAASHLESMRLIMDPSKLVTIQALNRISSSRSETVKSNAIAKAPGFAEGFEVCLDGLSDYRRMEICSLLPLLPTTERYLSDMFFRIHEMGETERPQKEHEIQTFLRTYESAIAEWAIRTTGSSANIIGTPEDLEALNTAIKSRREVTKVDGRDYTAPFELPTPLIGRIRYKRPGERTLWGRFWHLLSKPVSDYPSEDHGSFSSEMLAAIRSGRRIFMDMGYIEILEYVSQYRIGFQLFTAVKMENSKRSANTRVTANPQRVPKWVISDLEREVRSESWRYPCLTQTKSSQWRSKFWETLGTEVRSGAQWLLLFQDCAAWSEGQNRLRNIRRDNMAIEEQNYPEYYRRAYLDDSLALADVTCSYNWPSYSYKW